MFAELHTKSHYTFLTGASSPEELVYQAAELGYSAIAITDECSFAGLVKAYKASEECGIKLIVRWNHARQQAGLQPHERR